MNNKPVLKKRFRFFIWCLLGLLLLNWLWIALPAGNSNSRSGNGIVFAQDGPGDDDGDDDDDDDDGQGLCSDGVTFIPAGVDIIQFCRDNALTPNIELVPTGAITALVPTDAITAPDTVIPAGLPRTGVVGSNMLTGAGILFVMGLAVVAAIGLWRWRSQ